MPVSIHCPRTQGAADEQKFEMMIVVSTRLQRLTSINRNKRTNTMVAISNPHPSAHSSKHKYRGAVKLHGIRACQKSSCLPHSWGRWPSEARSEGVPTFLRKVGTSEYLLCKYSGSPRPSATPLINEGGKIVGSFLYMDFTSTLQALYGFYKAGNL